MGPLYSARLRTRYGTRALFSTFLVPNALHNDGILGLCREQHTDTEPAEMIAGRGRSRTEGHSPARANLYVVTSSFWSREGMTLRADRNWFHATKFDHSLQRFVG
jgi:hypothetical protein